MKTVKEVASFTGVSVRTLHYYDEIGLLPPTYVNEKGYRFYDEKALQRLEQILFFKEFDIPLKQIANILDNPHFDKQKILQEQKKILLLKRKRYDDMLLLVERLLKGESSMAFEIFSKQEIEQMYTSMLSNLQQEQKEAILEQFSDWESFQNFFFEMAGNEKAQSNFQKMVQWYGDKQKVMEIVQNPNQSAIVKAYSNRMTEIYQKYADCKEKNPGSFSVKELVGEYEFVAKQLYQVEQIKPILLATAKLYQKNEKVRAVIDKKTKKGTALFIAEAIEYFYNEK